MTVATSLVRIRRRIRDTAITPQVSDARLLRLYNLGRGRFVQDTKMKLRAAVLLSPPRWDYSITHDWEGGSRGTSDSFWTPFSVEAKGYYRVSQPWEAESIQGATATTPGGYFGTVAPDIMAVQLENQVRYPLPRDFGDLVVCMWKGERVDFVLKCEAILGDRNWRTSRGLPSMVTLHDGPSGPELISYKTFNEGSVLSSSHSNVTEHHIFHKDDSKDGILNQRESGDLDYSELGDRTTDEFATNSFLIFYRAIPADISAATDTDSIPRPFTKFVEDWVVSRILSSEEPFMDSLRAAHYKQRYQRGVRLVRGLMNRLSRYEVKQLSPESMFTREGRRPGLGKLPDHYPKLVRR